MKRTNFGKRFLRGLCRWAGLIGWAVAVGGCGSEPAAEVDPWLEVTPDVVSFGSDEVGIYKITDAATGAVVPVKSIYWKNTQPANIIAWYAKPQPDDTNNGRIFLNNQEDDGLVYVLRAEQTATYGETPVTLKFKHQLAKVRVIIEGTVDVIDVELANLSFNLPEYCDVKEGEIVNNGIVSGQGFFMHRTNYEGIGTCWEANLPPSSDYKIECFRVTTSDYKYTKFCEIKPYVTLEAGKVHTITITVNFEGTQIINLSTLTAPYEIDDSGTYYATGTGQYGIRVTNGSIRHTGDEWRAEHLPGRCTDKCVERQCHRYTGQCQPHHPCKRK